MTGRVDPSSAEECVVGGVLASEYAGGTSRVLPHPRLQRLTPEHFQSVASRAVWQAIKASERESGDAHPERVLARLDDELRRYVVQLVGRDGPTPSAALSFAQDLETHHRVAKTRRAMEAASECLKDGDVEGARSLLGRIAVEAAPADDDSADVASLVRAVVEGAGRPARPDADGNVPWGIPEVDQTGAYLRPGDFALLAGRPGRGKTTLAIQVATEVIRRLARPVVFASLEMTPHSIVHKAVVSIAGVRDPSVPSVVHTPGERDDFAEAAGWLQDQPLHVPSDVPKHVAEFCPWLERACKRWEPCLVVLDYLGLLTGRGGSQYERVSYASSQVRGVALRTEVPILCLHQMNRGIEHGAGSGAARPPVLSDLRDSGQIEQDATHVAFLHKSKDRTLLVFRKNRWGPCPTVQLYPNFERSQILRTEKPRLLGGVA